MHSTRTLTEDDLALLPSFAKALSCGCDTTLTTTSINARVSVTPPFLQFIHDQPSGHLAEVTLWNQSLRHIEVDLEPLQQPNIFHAFCDKNRAYGGSQIKLCVKCTPGGRKLTFDCLRILVKSKSLDGSIASETLSLPIQLCPGNSWFSIPKVVVMPPVSVGNVVEVAVPLPQPPEPEKFFVVIKTTSIHALTVTPFHGVLGGGGGGDTNDTQSTELLIRYTPKDYTTLVTLVQLYFPGVDISPHEIVVYGRASPGIESEVITRETVGLEEFVAATRKVTKVVENRRLPEPKLKFFKGQQDTDEGLGDDQVLCGQWEEDLTTPAGVMHFLVRKDGRTNWRKANQKNLRQVGEQFLGNPDQTEEEMAEIEAEDRRAAREATLRPFIQASYVIMMRYRVSKRIPKIRQLIQDLKAAKQVRSAPPSAKSSRMIAGTPPSTKSSKMIAGTPPR